MNKLTAILTAHFGDNMPLSEEAAEQAIIDLFLGLVGEDNYTDSTAVLEYKHELRTKFLALSNKEAK